MIRFVVTLLAAALGIGLFILAGSILLPVLGIFLIIFIIAALFGKVHWKKDVKFDPPEPEVDEVPASQAVIDVEAVSVNEDDDTSPRAASGKD